MRNAVLALLALLLCSTPAAAQQNVPPKWLKQPAGADLLHVYPPEAMLSEQEGRVMLDCTVALDTTLTCTAIQDTNPGLGFSEAALKLVRKMRMSPATVDGVPVAGARVRVPLSFKLENAPLRTFRLPTSTIIGRKYDYDNSDGYYPYTAIAAGVDGYALAACNSSDGAEPECETLKEEPAGHEFGASAIDLALDTMPRIFDKAIFPFDRIFLPTSFVIVDNLNADLRLWADQPTKAQVRAAHPTEASRTSGEVALACVLTTARALDQCVVKYENPKDAGFGAAALSLAKYYRMSELFFGKPGLRAGKQQTVAIQFSPQ